jgi:hypothetical protein
MVRGVVVAEIGEDGEGALEGGLGRRRTDGDWRRAVRRGTAKQRRARVAGRRRHGRRRRGAVTEI